MKQLIKILENLIKPTRTMMFQKIEDDEPILIDVSMVFAITKKNHRQATATSEFLPGVELITEAGGLLWVKGDFKQIAAEIFPHSEAINES